MKGTVETRILGRSIVKHIKNSGLFKAGPGRDYMITDISGGRCLVSAMGFSDTSAVISCIRAVNNLSMSGAEAEKISVSLVCGEETQEKRIRAEMNALIEYVKTRGIELSGGNTVFSGEGENLAVTVTAYGHIDSDTLKQVTSAVTTGDYIFMTGYAGEYGASLLYEERREDLGNRFPKSYIEKETFEASFGISKMDVSKVAGTLIRSGAIYLHDISFGGVYRALYELSEVTAHGVEIVHEKLPIKQSTIEISEFFGRSPYCLLGTGGVVGVVKQSQAEDFCRKVSEDGVEVSLIGHITEEKEKKIVSEIYDIKRSITMYEEDEIYKI